MTAASDPTRPSTWALLFILAWVGGMMVVFARGAFNYRGSLDRTIVRWRKQPRWMRFGQSEEAFRRRQRQVAGGGLCAMALLELVLLWQLVSRIV